MTKEQSFFIQILADHLNGRETKCNDVLDWNIIHDYARKHQVSGIVYTQAKDYMSVETMNVFRQETMAALYHATQRDNDFLSVTKELNVNNIPHFVVKGPAVAELYPVPKLRAMGDIDLVIKHEDREKCHNIIINSGYKCISKQDDREWQYYKNNVELELHDRLVYDEAVNEKGQDAFFNDCWKYAREGKLDWNFHLLFLIFHLRKHFMNSGVGFRMFMDLAVVAVKMHIDWTGIQDNLKNTGMLEFAKKCYGFIELWFGIRTPIKEKIESLFFEEATQKIFKDGVFGFDNYENRTNVTANILRNSKHPKLSLFHLYVKELFPSWKLLSGTSAYNYLNNSKLLLPIAWIHRLCRNVGKRKSKLMIASMNDYDKRMTWLEKWGLFDIE